MQINIRKAEVKDTVDVFNLSNLNSTRKYSINRNNILWEDHINWYDEVLKNEKIALYILADEKNMFLGQVRYNIDISSAEISISIVEELKGKGYSLDILLKSQELIKKEKHINRIKAVINNKNYPSIKLFEKAGYDIVKSEKDFSEYVLDI